MSDAPLKVRIQDDLKVAMRNKDAVKVGILRLVTAALKQREVDERIILTDDIIVSILEKMLKQRLESITQFKQGNRPDLVEKEQNELQVIGAYLPEKLPENEVRQIIQHTIAELQANSIKDMGRVISALRSKLQGRADIAQVSQWVKDALNTGSA